MTNMNQAPQAVRRHIAIFGRRNVGKSSLLNAITGQQVAIVSPEAGTTTDPVNRAMEIHSLGPCLLIDTAGYDDEGNVGELRNERTRKVLDQADMALLVFDQTHDLALERQWLDRLQQLDVPVVLVLNKVDLIGNLLQAVPSAPPTRRASNACNKPWLRLVAAMSNSASQVRSPNRATPFCSSCRKTRKPPRADSYCHRCRLCATCSTSSA